MGEQHSTKEQIIALLGERYPLTVKQIHKELKTYRALSYQAVHKTLNELIASGQVEKVDKLCYLNKEWLAIETQRFARFYGHYFRVSYNPNEIDGSDRVQLFRFNTHHDVLDFFVAAYAKDVFGTDDSAIYVSLRRLYPIIPPSLLHLIRKVGAKRKICVLCRNDGLSDRWSARLLRTLGVQVKTGVNVPVINSICIGNLVLQYFFFFDETYKNKIYSFYDRFKKKSNMSLLKINSDIVHKKGDLYILIVRYPVYVESIKRSMMDAFGHQR
jgi:hypothetical protein